MIIVDTNVISYLFLASECSDQVEQLLAKGIHWAAPSLWRSEFRNVLATYLKQDLIDLDKALQIISEAEQLMKDSEYQIVSSQVLRLSKDSGCSAYDCEFVALAMDLNVPFITCDKRLITRFPQVAISLDEFLSSH
jgi:predicted nucleic acid-binding protein